MLNTTQSYRLIAKDLDKSLKITAARPDVQREAAYYTANIGKIKTVDDFVNDKRLFSFAMTAYGLEDMTYAKAMVRKALNEGVENPKSFANRMVDPRLREFVTAFNFARNGPFTTQLTAATTGTLERYTRQQLEKSAGAQNEGVRLALYFERKASGIGSAYTILADAALSKVVRTALDIPQTAALQSIERQAATIEKKLDLASLKTPAKLKSFIEKFTTKWELSGQAPQAATTQIGVLGASGSAALSSTTLASLQMLKLGGN